MKTFIYYDGPFYDESGTKLSCLTYENGCRADWGKVQLACRNGEVRIRPATPDEMLAHYKRLEAIKKK